jgi:hypothetical protein
MFDPDVLDPLIKEHGIDKYGLIIRLVGYFILIFSNLLLDQLINEKNSKFRKCGRLCRY